MQIFIYGPCCFLVMLTQKLCKYKSRKNNCSIWFCKENQRGYDSNRCGEEKGPYGRLNPLFPSVNLRTHQSVVVCLKWANYFLLTIKSNNWMDLLCLKISILLYLDVQCFVFMPVIIMLVYAWCVYVDIVYLHIFIIDAL